jgi:hypothetical protein
MVSDRAASSPAGKRRAVTPLAEIGVETSRRVK